MRSVCPTSLARRYRPYDAGTGVISRLCGEVFGSALTFGAAGKASAPGQMGVEDLKTVLALLHKSL